MFLPIYNLAQKRGAWTPSLDLLLMYHCWVIPIENMENFKNDSFLENKIDSFDTFYYDFICLLIYNEKYRSIQFWGWYRVL
jgi:hypothetical protein